MEHYNLNKFKTPCTHIIKIYLIFGSSNTPNHWTDTIRVPHAAAILTLNITGHLPTTHTRKEVVMVVLQNASAVDLSQA